MDTQHHDEEGSSLAPATLIAYRDLAPESATYFTLGIKAYLLAIAAILVGVAAAIMIGLLLGIGAIVSGFAGAPTTVLVAFLVVVLATIVWLHVFLCHMAAIATILKRRGARQYVTELKGVYREWWRLLALVFSIQLLVSAGLMLFIIPGVVALVYLSFALYSFLTETPRVRISLARSVALVHGRFTRVALRLGVIVATVFTLMFTLMLVGIAFPVLYLTIPFVFLLGSLATMALFHSAVATRPRTENPPEITSNDTKLYILLMAIAAGFLAVMSILMPSVEVERAERTTSLIDALEDARLAGELLAYKDAATSLIEAASSFKEQNLGYEDLCTTEGDFLTNLRAYATQFDAGVNCESSTEAFVVEGKLTSGEWLCFDATGEVRVVAQERQEEFACGAK